MRTIWKYQLATKEVQAIRMPKGAEILSAHEQHGEICLWAKVDQDAPRENRWFEIYGTGHDIRGSIGELKFIETVLLNGGSLVFHVFERI